MTLPYLYSTKRGRALACLENHMNTDHFKNYVNAVGSLIEEKVVHKMTRIE